MRVLSAFILSCLVGVGAQAGAQPEAFSEVAQKRPVAAGPEEGVQRAPSGYVMAAPGMKLRRGWFAEGEFGVMMSFGGYLTPQVANQITKVSVSNAQPYFGLNVGYDLYQGESFTLSLGPSLAFGFNSGAGRPSEADRVSSNAMLVGSDYSIFQAGLSLGLSWLLSERWALFSRLGGGGAIIDPNPTVVATDAAAGDPSLMGSFNASLGVEVYTLLTGFSVGFQVRFLALLGEDFVPALAFPISVKYNF